MTKEQFNSIKLVDARKAGNSTRIVDLLVQELFSTGQCEYWDHADKPTNVALEHTLNVLRKRLHYEHNLAEGSDYRHDRKNRKLILSRLEPIAASL